MRFEGFSIVLAVGLLGACTDRRFETFPVNAETKTVLVLVQDPNGSVQAASALVVGQPWILERSRNDDWTATALLYDLDLDALGLMQGELQIVPPEEEGQPLPRPDGVFEQQLDGDRSWQLLTELPTRLEAVRLKTALTDIRRCVDQGGCFVNEARGQVCEVPCPDTTVPIAPAPPQSVQRPEFGPCRAGWQASDAADSICIPPSAVESACPVGTFQPLGQATCQSLGRTCTSPWPPDDALRGIGEVWYVQPSSTGNGTRTSPFGTVAEALAASAPGDVIALSTGIHSGGGTLSEGRTLAGACVEQTVLTGGIQVLGTEVAIGNLTLEGTGLRVEATGSATVTGIAIEATGMAVEMIGGTLSLSTAQITATEDALRITSGGHLTLEAVRVDGSRQTGLLATGMGTNVVASDLWIRPTGGTAMQVTDGATTRLEGVWLEDGEQGIQGEGEQTNIFLSDGRLTNTAIQAISIQSGAFEAHRTSVIETPLGISAQSGAHITLSDVHVAHLTGRGLDLQNGATLSAERLHISDVRDHAIHGHDHGEWTIEDLTVEALIKEDAIGINAVGGQLVRLSRAYFLGQAQQAVHFERTPATIEDITTEGEFERAVVFFHSPEAILRRLSIAQPRGDGIRVTFSDSLQLEDAHVVQSGEAGIGEAGIFIDDTKTEMDRIHIDQPNQSGLVALNSRELRVRDIAIEGSVENPDPSSVSNPNCLYRAVRLAVGAHGIFERFSFTNGACIGIELDSSGAELRQGIIARHAIGAQIGSTEDASVEGVRFEDNILNIFYLTD